MALSPEQRNALGIFLSRFASDDELQNLTHTISSRFSPSPGSAPAPGPEDIAKVAAELPNTAPPGNAVTRIGQDTQKDILRVLNGAPATLEHIAKAIKRKPEDAQALLKLLWERSVVRYHDGLYRDAGPTKPWGA